MDGIVHTEKRVGKVCVLYCRHCEQRIDRRDTVIGQATLDGFGLAWQGAHRLRSGLRKKLQAANDAAASWWPGPSRQLGVWVDDFPVRLTDTLRTTCRHGHDIRVRLERLHALMDEAEHEGDIYV